MPTRNKKHDRTTSWCMGHRDTAKQTDRVAGGAGMWHTKDERVSHASKYPRADTARHGPRRRHGLRSRDYDSTSPALGWDLQRPTPTPARSRSRTGGTTYRQLRGATVLHGPTAWAHQRRGGAGINRDGTRKKRRGNPGGGNIRRGGRGAGRGNNKNGSKERSSPAHSLSRIRTPAARLRARAGARAAHSKLRGTTGGVSSFNSGCFPPAIQRAQEADARCRNVGGGVEDYD
ncbi:hypothetical protein B0H17DRAFT_1143022 [Mycena rosella]|uniref:Uncharacterized protein n=1 Tax=Mycena rosella TaxID=1033263 RepID=A0AAD7G4Z1_MYCRO|nr:hypothetical protein B0H17DRAFT_1143022 [Mycena rosella]